MKTPRRSQKPPALCHAMLWASLGCLALFAGLLGCDRRDIPEPGGAQHAAGPTAVSFELTDQTPGVLLTWLDDAGDFHVEDSLTAVPEGRRTQVRVVRTELLEGTGDSVFVADLTQKDAEGRYALSVMKRSEWDTLGAERRKVRMDAVLAPSASPTASLNAPADPALVQRVRAVVYGASWCQPCHDAEGLLKKLGVNVTKKDIESSRAAQAEMQSKLTKAGKSGASIPVIDVGGELFVGFNPDVIRGAVKRAAAKLKPAP